MEKITLLKFFEFLSSKIRCLLLTKDMISKLGFYKFINCVRVDTVQGLKKRKENLLHYSVAIALFLTTTISF